MDEITPVPPKFSTAHEFMINSSNEFDFYIQYMGEGIKELYSAKIRLANSHLENVAEYNLQIKGEIERIINE